MAGIRVEFPESVSTYYISEMNGIEKTITQYPGFRTLAASLTNLVPKEIVAGLIGCIVPESGTDHTILNAKEYNGRGAAGTYGWNCGEGLIQWTFWKYKLPLIKEYNSDPRSRTKLPVTWEQYCMGTPVKKNGKLCAVSDGRHIAGLSIDDQMIFLVIYYKQVINQLKGESNLATIVARIYQKKAGMGYFTGEQNPIIRAYNTAKERYPSSSGNHYLQSLKIAIDYMNYNEPQQYIFPIGGDYEIGKYWNTYESPVYSPVKPTEVSGMNSDGKIRSAKGIILGYHLKQK